MRLAGRQSAKNTDHLVLQQSGKLFSEIIAISDEIGLLRPFGGLFMLSIQE